jgi:tRNA G18 (ribose-2'-O)-methylase SpoU
VKTVTSKDNPVLKAARKLLSRKGREDAGAALAAGRKLIDEAVSAGFEAESIFINAGALSRGEAALGEYANEIALDVSINKVVCDLCFVFF